MSKDEEVPEELDTDEKAVIENWEELKEIPIQEYFDKGWKPRVKTKGSLRYITLRGRFKDLDGKSHDSDKSLGPYDPERWEVIQSMYPKKDIFTHPSSRPKKTKVFDTTLGKPKAIPKTVPLDSDLVEYYLYFQKKGYVGDMGDWLKECIRNYLTDKGLEIAVVIRPIGEQM